MAQVSETGGMNNLMVDAGTTAFTTSATTVAVSTTLSYVYAGIGATQAGYGACLSAAGNVTAGSVTFNRADTTSGDTLHFLLIGF